MRSSRIIVLLALLCGSLVSMSAQHTRINPETGRREYLEYYIGGYGGLNIKYHAAEFGALPGVPSCCGDFTNGTSLGLAVGGLYERHLTEDLRLQGRVGFASLGGLLTSTQTIGNEPVLDDGPAPTTTRRDVQVEYTLDAGLPLLVLEPAVGYKAMDLLWLYAGVRAGLLVGSSYDQKETLIAPDGYVFQETGSAVRNASTGSIPEASVVNLHLAFGLGYELTIGTNLTLIPEVRYFLPVNDVASVSWSVQTFQLGASVRYGTYRVADPTIIVDTVYVRDTAEQRVRRLNAERVVLKSTESEYDERQEGDYLYKTTTITESYVKEIPVPFDPRMKLAAYAKNASGKRVPVESITMRELEIVESYPLLPYVFFAEGKSALSETTMLTVDSASTTMFRPSGIKRDQLAVYRNLLNILGQRMGQRPDARIRVTGCVSNVGTEARGMDIAKARAAAIKAYLVDVWKIEPKRITTDARLLPESPGNNDRPEGRAENQRAEISSSDLDLLGAVEFRDLDRSVEPAVVELTPEAADAEDITEWSVSVNHMGKTVVERDETGTPTVVEWKPGETGRLTPGQSVRMDLTASNGLGQSIKSSLQVPVNMMTLQEARSTREGGKLVERYSLIVFDYNSAKLNAANQKIMDLVRSRVTPETKVLIRGFADRTGDPEYNRELALRRCTEAKRVLNVPDEQITLEAIGSDQLIYDNESAEGRSYCRTVQIEIETPIR